MFNWYKNRKTMKHLAQVKGQMAPSPAVATTEKVIARLKAEIPDLTNSEIADLYKIYRTIDEFPGPFFMNERQYAEIIDVVKAGRAQRKAGTAQNILTPESLIPYVKAKVPELDDEEIAVLMNIIRKNMALIGESISSDDPGIPKLVNYLVSLVKEAHANGVKFRHQDLADP